METELNYMTELKAMQRYFIAKSPGKAVIALLQALYMVANTERSNEWFEADGDCLNRLMGGYSRKAICEAREKLCRMGRIEYKAGDRNCRKASYKIIPFATTNTSHTKYIALSIEKN